MPASATRYTPIDAPASIADAIRIRGARQNNLRNLSLDLALNRLTVVTGVSGPLATIQGMLMNRGPIPSLAADLAAVTHRV